MGRGRVWLAMAIALFGIIPMPGILASPSAQVPSILAGYCQTTVTVDTSVKAIGAIGNGYIGLSLESGTLNSGNFKDVGDLPQLLRNLGSSVMRVGGNSVDRSYTGITPSALAGLARLASAWWTVLYSENRGSSLLARPGRAARH